MIHQMRLMHHPFEKIRAGTKTVEMRLYDEKRAAVRVGDTIRFEDTDSGERMDCVVLALHRYATFTELYAHHDKVSLGYDADQPACPEDMLACYPAEKIERYGVVGIELKTI